MPTSAIVAKKSRFSRIWSSVSCGNPMTMNTITFRSAATAARMLSSMRSVFIFFLMSLRVSSEPDSGA